MTDVALDPYTSHGHDGIIKNKKILNDETIQILSKQAILQSQMGCDVIAPSDMMDGRIGACLLYTSDAADDTPCVDLGGRRIIKKSLKN